MSEEVQIDQEVYDRLIAEGKSERIARAITRRHESLATFLRLFDLDEDTIHEDVEGMEHHVSAQSLAAFQALTAELERQPALLKRVKDRMAEATS